MSNPQISGPTNKQTKINRSQIPSVTHHHSSIPTILPKQYTKTRERACLGISRCPQGDSLNARRHSVQVMATAATLSSRVSQKVRKKRKVYSLVSVPATCSLNLRPSLGSSDQGSCTHRRAPELDCLAPIPATFHADTYLQITYLPLPPQCPSL